MSQTMLILLPGVWLGFVLGISFLEAPLKFRAPGITRALGLGIGKLIFGALNKVERYATRRRMDSAGNLTSTAGRSNFLPTAQSD